MTSPKPKSFMKYYFLTAVFIGLSASIIFSQTSKVKSKTSTKLLEKKSQTVSKPTTSKVKSEVQTVKTKLQTPAKSAKNIAFAEISQTDWKKLSGEIYNENWENSSELSLRFLNKLTKENSKKQAAQLRYIYLYSLAGKVSEEKLTIEELEKAAQKFVGKEFLMVSRQILEDCETKVNFICRQKVGDKILRVTATNQSASAVHFFEYVKLKDSFNLSENKDKVAFLGGILNKIEVVSYKDSLKILRLIFSDGYVKIATD